MKLSNLKYWKHDIVHSAALFGFFFLIIFSAQFVEQIDEVVNSYQISILMVSFHPLSSVR